MVQPIKETYNEYDDADWLCPTCGGVLDDENFDNGKCDCGEVLDV